jgi:hypothetical protein
VNAALKARIADKVRSSWPDALIVGALLGLFGIVHRFVECVEIGGDAISKWHFVRQWSYENDLSHAKWDHHYARMGVNGLTWLVQKIFGRNWRAYYVGPFFMAAVQLPLVYLIGKRLQGRATGVLAALFITFLGAVHRSASQLLPDGYAGTYALLAAYLFMHFVGTDEKRARLGWLIGVGVLAFVGYLTKETFFFFYPAFVIALLFAGSGLKQGLRDVAVFCGVLLVGLGLETLAYRTLTDYGSRLAVVRGTHLAGADQEPLVLGLDGFVKPFVMLERDWQVLLGVAFFGAVWLLVLNRRARALGRLLALLGLCHVGFLAISTQLFQSPRPRYFDPVTPFAALCAAAFVAAVVGKLGARGWALALKRMPVLTRFAPGARPTVTALWASAALLLVAGNVYRNQLKEPPFDGWAQGQRMAKLANRTYDRNLPLAAPSRSAKTLMTLYDVYMDDKRLARDGVLPNYASVKRRSGRFTYIVRDPRAYGSKTFERLLDAGCVVQLRRGSRGKGTRGYTDTKAEDLPASCDKLLAENARRK